MYISWVDLCSATLLTKWDTCNYYIQLYIDHIKVGKVKSAYEPKWPIRLELIPVSVALSD